MHYTAVFAIHDEKLCCRITFQEISKGTSRNIYHLAQGRLGYGKPLGTKGNFPGKEPEEILEYWKQEH